MVLSLSRGLCLFAVPLLVGCTVGSRTPDPASVAQQTLDAARADLSDDRIDDALARIERAEPQLADLPESTATDELRALQAKARIAQHFAECDVETVDDTHLRVDGRVVEIDEDGIGEVEIDGERMIVQFVR